MFGAIAGGIDSALAGGDMSKLFGGGQKAASGGIQGDVLANDNNTVGMGDAGIKSAIQGSNVPFFFQAEDGIRDHCVTGVQTCALPIWNAITDAGEDLLSVRKRELFIVGAV